MTPNKIEEQEPNQALEHKTPIEKVKTSWEILDRAAFTGHRRTERAHYTRAGGT
jgi:hypothetical protein